MSGAPIRAVSAGHGAAQAICQLCNKLLAAKRKIKPVGFSDL